MNFITVKFNKKSVLIITFFLAAACLLSYFSLSVKKSKSAKTLPESLNETATLTESHIQSQQQAKAEKSTEDGTFKNMKDKNGNAYFPKADFTVYLTFDDGPSKNTPQILTLLQKYGIGATFFVINGKYNSYMKDIVNAGSAIALHSYSHKYPEIYSSEKAFLDDLEKIHNLVKSETGVDTRIIRFPGGSSNTISRKYCRGIMTNLVKDTEEAGYIYFDWNCDNGDAGGKNVSADYQIKKATKYSKNAKNIVILMHDIDICGVNLDALSAIIDFYQSEGADFGIITENSPRVRHKVNN